MGLSTEPPVLNSLRMEGTSSTPIGKNPSSLQGGALMYMHEALDSILCSQCSYQIYTKVVKVGREIQLEKDKSREPECMLEAHEDL